MLQSDFPETVLRCISQMRFIHKILREVPRTSFSYSNGDAGLTCCQGDVFFCCTDDVDVG